jgi:mercuric ion transport protein
MPDAVPRAKEMTGPARGGAANGWLAAGSLFGAALVSTCCVVPLLLVTLGVSGAWIGNLTALEPYRPIFAAVAILLIGAGFWFVYFRGKADCDGADACQGARRQTATKVILWLAAILTLIALSVNLWAPLFY